MIEPGYQLNLHSAVFIAGNRSQALCFSAAYFTSQQRQEANHFSSPLLMELLRCARLLIRSNWFVINEQHVQIQSAAALLVPVLRPAVIESLFYFLLIGSV